MSSLTTKRTTGFHALKPGKIHIRCWNCGMKRSNVPRDEYDPPLATLIETPCEKCCIKLGAKDPGCEYYDASGRELSLDDDTVQGAYEQQ